MRFTRLVLTAFVFFLIVIPLVADENTADPRETLATAIPEGIRLLEAKEHEAF